MIEESWQSKVERIAEEIRQGKHGDLAAIVERAHSFRTRAEDMEREFIGHVRAIEVSGVWREVDAGTFEKWLSQNAVCKVERYRQGLLAFESLGEAVVTKIGMTAAKTIARIENPVVRQRAVTDAMATATRQGYPISGQAARSIAGPIAMRRDTQQAMRASGLERELAELRAEVDRLRALVTKLGGDWRIGAQLQETARDVAKAAARKGKKRAKEAA